MTLAEAAPETVLGLAFEPEERRTPQSSFARVGDVRIGLHHYGHGQPWMASLEAPSGKHTVPRVHVFAHADTPEDAVRGLLAELAAAAGDITRAVHALRDHGVRAPGEFRAAEPAQEGDR